ncbi:MAG: hypothetical protein V3571_14970 [Pseudodesulfovibrio sp.]
MDFLSAFNIGCGTGYWHGSGAGWMGVFPFHFGGLVPLLLLGLVIFFLLRTLRTPARETVTSSTEDVLKRRYAAGEIDRDTFLRMRDELK